MPFRQKPPRCQPFSDLGTDTAMEGLSLGRQKADDPQPRCQVSATPSLPRAVTCRRCVPDERYQLQVRELQHSQPGHVVEAMKPVQPVWRGVVALQPGEPGEGRQPEFQALQGGQAVGDGNIQTGGVKAAEQVHASPFCTAVRISQCKACAGSQWHPACNGSLQWGETSPQSRTLSSTRPKWPPAPLPAR